MQKNKRPNQKKASAAPQDQEEAMTQSLCALAIDLLKQTRSISMSESAQKKQSDFHKLVRKCLIQKKDDVLYEALERTGSDDSRAYLLLKEHIEEASGVIVFRREKGQDLEVNAFAIPLFAHTRGGLRSEQCFQDQEAFDLLKTSVQEAQLESRDASVVLVSHAYHPDEIDRISYSQLNEMVLEASDSMTGKKTAAAAIGRSMSGWPDSHFEPQDVAVELRFLLGFALKRLDDRFYQVPDDEAAADRYFEARAKRFRHWAQQVTPLVKRCLVTDGREIDIDFLYQDLFYGGKERGLAEYNMLQMMSELHHDLQQHGSSAEHASAVIGPAEADGEAVLRVNLHAEDGALVATAEKPIAVGSDLRAEADDTYDALQTLGVKSVSVARKFEADGQALDVRPYEN